MFFIRIIFFLLFATGAILQTVRFVQQCIDGGSEIGILGRQLITCILLYYVTFRLGQAAWHQRFTIQLAGDQVIVRDVFTFRRRVLQLNDIKGFSLMEYPTKWVRGKSIMLYLTEEEKLEFPEFLFFNFRKLDKALAESGLHFFGVESREWRWKKLE